MLYFQPYFLMKAMRNHSFWLFVLVLGLGACDQQNASTGAKENQRPLPPEQRLNLSFYAIPECFLCEEWRKELQRLDGEFGAQVNIHEYDYHSLTSQEGIKRFELGTHGIAITTPEGSLLSGLPAHEREASDIRSSMEQALAKVAVSPSPLP